MLTAENYHFAWLIYAASSLALLLVFFRIISPIKHIFIRIWLLATAACLICLPVRADIEQVFLAPATLVFLLEVLFIEGEEGLRVLSVLIPSLLGVWIALLVGWAGWFMFTRYRRSRQLQQQSENEAERQRDELLQESLAANDNNL